MTHPALRSVQRALQRIEREERLDRPAEQLQDAAKQALADPKLSATLSGAPIGHRLHPLLTDLPIGCWTSAMFLDAFAWRSGKVAARRLTGLGVLFALPTAASGLNDWASTRGKARRVGLVHMASNAVALVLYTRSWSARRRNCHVAGALYGLLGAGAATVGGYLGGHLAWVLGVGVDADVPVLDDDAWHDVAASADLNLAPLGVEVAGTRVVLVRLRGAVHALAATCTHAGGPLDEGTLRGSALKCPWHGSEFDVNDGSVRRGPAATPQPTYLARERDGRIEIRRVDIDDDLGIRLSNEAGVAEHA